MGTTTSPPPDFLAELIARKQKEMDDAAAKAAIDARSVGEQGGRDVRAFGTGLNDAVGNAVGAIPDLAASGMNAVVNLGRRAGGYSPDAQPFGAPGQYSAWARNALNSVGDTLSGGHLVPDTTAEKVLYGTGKGVGEAASVLVPAGVIARHAQVARGALGEIGGARQAMTDYGMATSVQPGSMTGSLATSMSSNPFMQTTAGGVGGGVEAGTGSKALGIASSLAIPLGAGVFRGLVSPGLSQLNPEQTRLRGVMADEGIDLTPGQASGSRPMKGTEAVLKELPFTAGPARAGQEAAQVQYNKAVLRRAGETEADYATPDVVRNMLDRAWGRVSDIYARNNLTIDAPAWQRFTTILNGARQDLGEEALRPIEARFNQLVSKMRGGPNNSIEVPGAAYATLDSDLSKLARTHDNAMVRDATLNMRNTLRDAFAANLTDPAEAAALAEARGQYANGKVIQAAMNAGTPFTIAGNIPSSGLTRELASGPGNKFASGHGDLRDLAAGGKTFLQESVPNSGTVQRGLYQGLLTGGFLGGGWLHDPMTSAALGTTSLALPAMVQGAMTSDLGRAYLTNQLAARMPSVPTGAMFGAAGTARLPGILDNIEAPAPAAGGNQPRRRSIDVYPQGDPRNRPWETPVQ